MWYLASILVSWNWYMSLGMTLCLQLMFNSGEVWPKLGEVDIIEGVNQNNVNKFVLHTDTNCTVNGIGQTDAQNFYDCALDGSSGASGCDVNAVQPNTYGAGFNANGGGVYAMEWTSEAIKMWFFPRGHIPPTITSKNPDTSLFGLPNANFQGACDIDKRLKNHRFIFDTTFCGDWAGNVYSQSGCPMYPGLGGMDSCKKFVAENPSAFRNAYWQISYFKTYTKKTVSSSSSVDFSTASSTKSSSSTVSSSSVATTSSSSAVTTSSASSSDTSTSSSSVAATYSSVTVSSSSVDTPAQSYPVEATTSKLSTIYVIRSPAAPYHAPPAEGSYHANATKEYPVGTQQDTFGHDFVSSVVLHWRGV